MNNRASVGKILDAFPEDIPSRALLGAAIEGRSKGRVILDESDDNPVESGAVIVLNKNGTTYVGRGASQEFFHETLSDLRRDQRLVLAMTSRQESEYDWDWLGERPVYERFEHADLDWNEVERISSKLPENRRIVPIDRALFNRCVWHDEISSMLGSEDQFLDNALGVCQMDGKNIIAEAYAILSDAAGAEIGGITHESYRRAGNGSITCACLLEKYLRENMPIYWCCDQPNVASAQTARRLGFRSKREYKFIIVPKEE